MLKDGDELYIKEYESKKRKLLSSKPKMLKSFLFSSRGRSYLKMKLFGKKKPLYKIIQTHLKKLFPKAKIDIKFFEHHLAHAYSTYYTSGFKDALVFSFDGEGDGVFSRLFEVKNGDFRELGSSKNLYVENAKTYEFADKGYLSVGNIYSIFTYLLGFTPHADEGKVEALAAFGSSENFLYEKLQRSYKIDDLSIQLQKEPLEELFSKEFLDRVFKELKKEDIASSVQKYAEDVVLEYLEVVKARYGCQNLAVAGGVMANVIINNKIYENLFSSLHITPAMGDDGIAQGSGCCIFKTS